MVHGRRSEEKICDSEGLGAGRERKIPLWEKWLVGGLVVAGGVGWAALGWVQHKAKDPIAIVRDHYVFYPAYRGGVWSEGACDATERAGCKRVRYVVPVMGCGDVRFDWSVFADGDEDLGYAYRGATPRIDEDTYALYALVGADARFMDSPALGKQVPAKCVVK
jgi:hypothetical protein